MAKLAGLLKVKFGDDALHPQTVQAFTETVYGPPTGQVATSNFMEASA